jgi:hypothetical protein
VIIGKSHARYVFVVGAPANRCAPAIGSTGHRGRGRDRGLPGHAFSVEAPGTYPKQPPAVSDAGVIEGNPSVEADELAAAHERITALEAELALTRDACEPFDGGAPKHRRAITEGLIARGLRPEPPVG